MQHLKRKRNKLHLSFVILNLNTPLSHQSGCVPQSKVDSVPPSLGSSSLPLSLSLSSLPASLRLFDISIWSHIQHISFAYVFHM